MKASVAWLNRYLDPGDLSAEAVEHVLTHAGFPIDGSEALPGGDTGLEVELTSNRGDCLSHLGLAREIAAATSAGGHKRALKLPTIATPKATGRTGDALSLQNLTPESCPRFTAQVVRGVKVGPSPAWLVRALESVGQRSINNIVDATNFLNFEYGQPCHAFDLAKLAGRKLVVRSAKDGEALTTLDGKKRSLKAGEIVVADAERAQSLAGVIGGQDSEVSPTTTEVVLEVATWDPLAVRRGARRHQVRTDASHRFERIVDARTLDEPARRLLALVVEVAGGTPCEGMLDARTPAADAPLTEIALRPQRVRCLLGIEIQDQEIVALLKVLQVNEGSKLRFQIPAFRPDLAREVDLIEEVARIKGFDAIPAHARTAIEVKSAQDSELASRALGDTLAALGFFETVTFSFVTDAAATPFLQPGRSLLHVSDERRGAESALRPSILPSLLACRKANQDGHAVVPGGIRLFETAAVFAEAPPASLSQSGELPGSEQRVLALVMDVPGVGKGKPGTIDERQHAVRVLRGAIEAAAAAMGGREAAVELRPAPPRSPAFDAAAHAEVLLNGRAIGSLGLIAPGVQKQFDLDAPAAMAEIEIEPLLTLFPPRAIPEALPQFPAIERDLSLIVDEPVRWAQVRSLVESAALARLEAVDFVGTYRGKQIGEGKKSVTLRLRFRDPVRTLRHEEVDPQVASAVALAGQRLGATLRG